jgi:hypothetical protein
LGEVPGSTSWDQGSEERHSELISGELGRRPAGGLWERTLASQLSHPRERYWNIYLSAAQMTLAKAVPCTLTALVWPG